MDSSLTAHINKEGYFLWNQFPKPTPHLHFSQSHRLMLGETLYLSPRVNVSLDALYQAVRRKAPSFPLGYC